MLNSAHPNLLIQQRQQAKHGSILFGFILTILLHNNSYLFGQVQSFQNGCTFENSILNPDLVTGCAFDEITKEEINNFSVAYLDCVFYYVKHQGFDFTYDPGNGIYKTTFVPPGNFHDLEQNDPQYWTDNLNGNAYASLLIQNTNERLSHFSSNKIQDVVSNYDPQWDFIGDLKIRFKIKTNGADDGIYYVDNISEIVNRSDAINVIINTAASSTIGSGSYQTQSGKYKISLVNAYINNYLGLSAGFWVYSNIVAHEFFHSPAAGNLCHSFAVAGNCANIDILTESECNTIGLLGEPTCGGPDQKCIDSRKSGSTNIMSYTSPVEPALSMCQAKEVWKNLLSKYQVEKFISMEGFCEQSLSDLRLSTGLYIWNTPRFYNRNVILEAGTDLTISCFLLMGANCNIIVQRGARLTIDGGRISGPICNNAWAGITVEGNSAIDQPDPSMMPTILQSGIIRIINGGVIEYAINGIQTIKQNEAWNQAYWGGLIIAENSTFKNNKRAIAFMKYLPSNKSKIMNCKFSEVNSFANSEGISIWNCKDINIQGSTFELFDKQAIFGIDMGANINNNTFANTNRGITSRIEYPTMDGVLDISNNIFTKNASHCIWLDGTSLISKARIIGNKINPPPSTPGNVPFSYETIGIALTGSCFVDIFENKIENKYIGLMAENTGELVTLYCNKLNLTSVGFGFIGSNKNLLFSNNLFTSSNNNVYNSSNNSGDLGEINSPQGQYNNLANDAKNCFGNNSDILATLDNSIEFKYLVPENTIDICINPSNNLSDGGVNNYSQQISIDINDHICNNQFGQVPIREPYLVPKSYLYYLNHRDSLIIINTSNTTLVSQINLYYAQENLDNKLRQEILSFSYTNNPTELLTIFNIDSSINVVRKLIDAMIKTSNYSYAQSIINSMNNLQPDDFAYQSISSIQLQLAQQSDSIPLTQFQINTLSDIANTELPSSNMARGILSRKLGAEFEIPLYFPQILPRENLSLGRIRTHDFTIVPNPANSSFQVKTNGNLCGDLSLVDLYGRLIDTKPAKIHDQEIQFDISDLSPGIYYVKLPKSYGIIPLTLLVMR